MVAAPFHLKPRQIKGCAHFLGGFQKYQNIYWDIWKLYLWVMIMHKKIYRYLPLTIPSLICAVWLYLASNHNIMNHDGVLLAVLITAYIISVAGIIFYIKLRPFNVWWVPLSFLISPISVFIYEYPGGSFMPFLGTVIVATFYAVPLFLVSVIVAIVLSFIRLNIYIRR